MKTPFTLLLLGLSTLSLFAQSPAEPTINAASLFNGSYMHTTPASYVPSNLQLRTILNYTPEALYDQSAKLWCSPEGAKFPFVFQIEFTESYSLTELVFNNVCENYPGIGVKDVDVDFATAPGDAPFTRLGSYALRENEVNRISIPPTTARAIRLTIRSNHGNKKFTELAEFEANGVRQMGALNVINVDGTWNSNWGDVYFQQNNSLLSGSYVYNEGVVQYGGIDRHQIKFKWVEKKINNEGSTIMNLNQEGTRLTGVWCHGGDWENYGFWILDRKVGVPLEAQTQAAVVKETVMDNKIVDELKTELDKNKKIILYGINFETNSAVLMPSSISTVQHVVEMLKGNPGIKIRVEGHTDDVGSEAYNAKLSLERAKSVFTYITEVGGIAADRVVFEGKGELSPVASNATELGKSANRRVELHQVGE